ncbi:MinD/ParA family ATP-binding protein [Microterricola viridarii]|uniref:MinD-like ATPase involved in chromosome partitioning or flagellar assembly n=1 Tax=Microterricola viridarii TaxID=412690 RepID=A0A1H1VZU3_9MICO|nr:MinD/ParA family protein [Microterricola viridarii]SDS90344.1 MinD-like ATPase involved in chromosome partitioning or flagellar assembly [Microterricola viridarii]
MPNTKTSDDEFHSELPPETVDSLASSLPESLSIQVDLPAAPARVMPADEVAVAIDEVAVNPGYVESSAPSTTSIEVVTPPLRRSSYAAVASAAAAPAASPYEALLATDAAAAAAQHSRRDRVRSEHVDMAGGYEAPVEHSRGDGPEDAGMLTADRLLEVNRRTRPAPKGGWNRFVYNATFHGVNLGDSAKVRAEQAMTDRIAKQFTGGTRFVPILTRKGGVGKTTVTTLLGMALADAREDRIIAVDANPDRGTLSERVTKQTRATVRDVVTKAHTITGFTDFSSLVSRDETRLDILASDTDPMLSEAFDENDYNVVADLAARFYSIVLTDCGTGIVHSVMRATLQRADSIVIVSGGSVDEARLASETLTWLEANGYGELVRNAVVAINTATQGTNLVKLEEIESHFQSRVREIVRIPYDPQLAAGSVVNYQDLKPLTRHSARTLAALVVEGLPADRGM